VLLGSQQPRVCYRQPWATTAAAVEAIELGESCGIYLDPWQKFCVEVILSAAESGKWAALEVAILVARQNGKGEVLLVVTLYWMFTAEPRKNPRADRLIVHTAHEFKTAREAYLRLKAVIDGNDWLSRRVKQEWTAHGEEGYLLTSDVRLRFLARSRSSGRGFTGDKVIFDEAQELPTLAMDALMPTLSARPNPMLLYTGTVPGPQNDAEHWTRLRDRGRTGKGKRMSWLEFNIGERLPREALYDGDDPELMVLCEKAWLAAAVSANPALGLRMDMEFVEAERESLSYMGYLRERLSIWSSDPLDMVIDSDTWNLMADPGSTMVGRRAIAVDGTPDLTFCSVSAMGKRADGHWHGEVIEHEPGSHWVAVRVREIVQRAEGTPGAVSLVVIDPGSPAGALLPAIKAELKTLIEREHVVVLEVTTRQHGAACGMLYARAYERDSDGRPAPSLHHLGDAVLFDALKAATKRPGPEGTWLWNRRDSEDDISPLVALTLAGYGLSTMPEEVSDPWGFWS
jgi:hypothetical protein